MKRRMLLCGALGAAALGVGATQASAAVYSVCALNGMAAFDGPGLNLKKQAFTYSFSGALTGCASTKTEPGSGTVSAGKDIVGSDGNVYQEPVATGTGSCSSSKTAGTAFVQWADGTLSIVDYKTLGYAAAVYLTSTPVSSITLHSAAAGTDLAFNSTRYVGDKALAALVFEATPTDCNTGVHTAGIAGYVELQGQGT